MSKRQNSQQWYQQKRWILASLLLFPPLGIPLLWLTCWPRAGKIGGSIFSSLILLMALTGESSEPTSVPTVPTVEIAEPPALETVTAPAKVEPVVSIAYGDAIAQATAATDKIAVAESSADWEQIASQWQEALSSLEDIPLSSSDYSQAQAKKVKYERNYDYAISQKAAAEAAQAEEIAQPQAEESEMAMPPVEVQGGYVSGTCKALKASGVGSDFRPGDANYTSARDRDNDGVACES